LGTIALHISKYRLPKSPDSFLVWLQIQSSFWYDPVHRQVVRVTHPADGVSVVNVTVRELGRAPAVDGVTDELFRAHQEGKEDREDNRVLAAQSVNIVVIDVKLELADTQNGLKEPLHAE